MKYNGLFKCTKVQVSRIRILFQNTEFQNKEKPPPLILTGPHLHALCTAIKKVVPEDWSDLEQGSEEGYLRTPPSATMPSQVSTLASVSWVNQVLVTFLLSV